MTALETYRAYGGKTTAYVPVQISVNGTPVRGISRTLGKYAAGGPVPNTVNFYPVAANVATIQCGEKDRVTLTLTLMEW